MIVKCLNLFIKRLNKDFFFCMMVLHWMMQNKILPFILKDCQILFARYFYITPLKEVFRVKWRAVIDQVLIYLFIIYMRARLNCSPGNGKSFLNNFLKLESCTSDANTVSHHKASYTGLLSFLGEPRKKHNDLCILLFTCQHWKRQFSPVEIIPNSWS